MASSGNGPIFEVIGSGVIIGKIRRLQKRASFEGRGQQFLTTLAEIVDRLERNPREVGDPLYRLAGMRIEVRTVLVRSLVVHFAVCEDRPVVFIKGIQLLP